MKKQDEGEKPPHPVAVATNQTFSNFLKVSFSREKRKKAETVFRFCL